MKTAKRVLAILVAIIMTVGTCAVAASAAESLQAQIDGGATEISLSKNTTESLTVNHDLTIKLNGYRLVGVAGKPAIKITAGTVKVTDGQVISKFANVSSADMIKTVLSDSPAAIWINGGSLEVEGVRIVGGMTRVPTTQDYFVPTGGAIQSYNGATVTIKRSSLYGDYGVNNKVSGNVAGGTVTVEDAIILGYAKAIKGDYEVASGSEEIIAADRIAGVLNSGITLEENEKKLINRAIDERAVIVTKTAEQLTTELGAAVPKVTKTEGVAIAQIEAAELDYTWPNTKGTDCSYILVPESITLSDGSIAALDSAESDYITEDSQKIRYRVEFKMSDEARPYIESLTKEGIDNPLDGVLGWAGAKLDELYKGFVEANNNNYVDTYDELIAELGELMTTIDEVGSTEIPDSGRIADLDEYLEIRKALYALAGKTGFDAKNTGYAFTQNQYSTIFGTTDPMPEYVGTLDRIQALKDQMEAIIGGSFTNTDKYGDLAVWAYETAYPELLAILDEAVEKLEDLQTLLSGGLYKEIVETLNIEDQVKLLDEGVENAKLIQDFVDDILENGDVKATLNTIERHKDEIKAYADKTVSVIENWRQYVDPNKFIIDNTYVKTYSTVGPITIETIAAAGNLHITINGAGKAYYNATQYIDIEGNVAFRDSFTLKAVADDDFEFLFWVNREGTSNRILSTEETFTMVTNIDRDIEAVFAYVEAPVAYFTNPTGDICGFSPVTLGDGTATAEVTSEIKNPYVAGYGFDGWPGESGGVVDLTSMNNTAYASGNSAFATLNTYYGEGGAILAVRPDSTSYIIVTKYSKAGGYTVTFKDGDSVYEETANYSDIVYRTAQNGDYWVIEGTDTIACVNAYYPYQVIDNATFVAVSGDAPEFVTNTTVKEEDGKAVFYVERSSKKAIKTTGIVYVIAPSATFNAETDLKIGGPNVNQATAKFTGETGLYAPSISISWLNGRTFLGAPYIEFADGTVAYGDSFQYN